MEESDNYPVGAVVIFGGELDPNTNWLLCDGRDLNKSEYPALFNSLGNFYGPVPVQGQTFRIPNFLGAFLKGRNGEYGEFNTLVPYTTKKPNTGKFEATFQNLPVSSKRSDLKSKEGIGFDGSATKLQEVCTEGGNAESRPVNVYVNYYIKAH